MNLPDQTESLASPIEESSNQTSNADTSKEPVIEEQVSYDLDGKKYLGHIFYKEKQKGKRPAILVVHEWWGLNDYSRRRAKQLAQLGYISMAVDVFGGGKTAEDPTSAQHLAMPFYKDPALTKNRLDPAIALLKTYPQTDASKMGAIGYCFGGLSGVKPRTGLLKAKLLVCHGAEDPMANPDVEEFRKEMDEAGADYIFKVYPGATHAFSNPNATAKGEKYNMPIKYNEAADKASWNDMKAFFQKIFQTV